MSRHRWQTPCSFGKQMVVLHKLRFPALQYNQFSSMNITLLIRTWQPDVNTCMHMLQLQCPVQQAPPTQSEGDT